MNRQLFCALSISLAAALAAHAAQQPGLPIGPPCVPGSLGVNIHFTDPRPGELPLLAAASFRWIRMDFHWAGTEREKGHYDFTAYDRLLAALAPYHIRAVLILDYANHFYDGGLSPASDEGRRAFARWAAAAALHFRGQGVLWEMYNEPNIGFWKPKPDVQQYVKLARAVGQALHAAAPAELYCGPGSSQIDLPFIEECFKAGLLSYWSAVTVHPYRQTAPETVTPEYQRLRRLIARYAPPGKAIPILSGEWGYSTAWHKFDAVSQGKMLPRQWLMNLANDIPVSIWYDWHDDGLNPKDPEHHFGTVQNLFHAGGDPIYDPKPAYRAAATLAHALAGCRYNKRLAVAADDDYVLLFTSRDARPRLAVWTTSATPHPVTIPASPGRFQLTSATGEVLAPLDAAATVLRVSVSDAPQYLAPDARNPLLEIAAGWSAAPLEFDVSGPSTPLFESLIENPLDQPIRVQARPSGAVQVASPSPVTLQPHATMPLRFRWTTGRGEGPVRVRFELAIEGLGTLAQQSQVVITNPLLATVLPAAGKQLPVRLENPSGEAFEGQVELLDAAGLQPTRLKLPVRFAAGQQETVATFPLQQAPAGQYRAGLKVDDRQGAPQFHLPPVTMAAIDDFGHYTAATLAAAYQLRPEGDHHVRSTQSFELAAPSEGPPLPGVGSLAVRYAFEPGWKFLLLLPAQSALKRIEGRPKAFGLWVYGDGSGNLLRLRFIDATHQTFQPQGEPMRWKGWHYVTFPFDDAQAGHWGGANDGAIHYPIRWDAMLLLDSSNRRQTAGRIYVAAPTLVYDGGR
jgi:hypothetical protein